MPDRSSRKPIAEKLALLAVGLGDEAFAAEVQQAVASDPELAARLEFLQALAGDEFTAASDHHDWPAHPDDAELRRQLRHALAIGEEPAIACAFRDLVRLYGGHAKTLLGKFFPELRNIHGVLEAVLLRAGQTALELDNTDESVRTWFLRMVYEEAVSVLKRYAEEEHARRDAALGEGAGTPHGGSPLRKAR